MQYIDKNLIIERYINGSMSPAEVQNFHTMLEHDSELRAMFRAENLLNSTISRDRVALEAADHSRMYATFLKNLADSIPQAATASAGAAGANGAVSWLAGISTSVKVAISAAVVTGGIAAGIALYQPSAEPVAVPSPQMEVPASDAPAFLPDASQQRTTAAQKPSGGTVSAPARTDKTAGRQLPNSGQPAQNVEAQTPSGTEDIPSFDKNTATIKMDTDRNK